MKLSPHQLVYLLHAVAVGPLLIYVGMCGNKCPKAVFLLLVALGLGVMVYHTYNFIMSVKRETFVHGGGYLGRPEPFVPFSYPNHMESNRYFSFHDQVNHRGCNCQHNDGEKCGCGCHQTAECQCGCHQGGKCDGANCACHCHQEQHGKEGFMLPNYGMKPVVPGM